MHSPNFKNQSCSSSSSCQEFSLGEIKRATNDFSKKAFLANVSVGTVYRGNISTDNYSGEVAVKRLNKKLEEATLILQKEKDVLTAHPHANIIYLVGFCDEEDEKILIYEFMQNSSLYGYLFTHRGRARRRLTLEQRLEICLDVAKGLSHLHSRTDLNFIHGDLNTNNILLDASLVPKISGLEFSITHLSSLLINNDKQGKKGYLAPECYELGYKPSQKADVYAFGLVLLEVLCERQSWNKLLVLGLPFIIRGELPKFTPKVVTENISPKCQRGCIKLMRSCLEFQADKRLDMNQVVYELEQVLKLQKRTPDAEDQNIKFQVNREQLSGVNISSKNLSLADIRTATKGFSYILGKGGQAKVYYGKISGESDNVDVAVKRMNINHQEGRIQAFELERNLLSTCHHVNIISLVGCCDEGDERILVYEFMPNGSLNDQIFNHHDPTPRMTIEQRLDICIGIANGLSYLHCCEDYKIIHSDLKTDNILLDDNWVPKIADFGLSRTRAIGPSTSAQVTNNIQGTEGYIAPECYEPNYKPSRKADVYAFGVVLLEVLCEKPAWERLVVWALPFVSKGELPNITPEYVKNNISQECLRACANLINACLEIDPNNRPTMSHIIDNLELALTLQKISPDVNNEKNNFRANSQQRFSLSDINKATNKFGHQNLLREMNDEKVYRGSISVDVDVKCKKRKADQEIDLFQNEINFLLACHHANVISLVGYCDETNESILVYESVPNVSLYDYLHTKKDNTVGLTVVQRLEICLGVAKGLSYLHSSNQSNTIRIYLNSDSILLDRSFVPKIYRFEFHRNSADVMSTQRFKKYKQGMNGYLPPEFNAYTYKISNKMDVYAFGVVVLEVLCEKQPAGNGLVTSAHQFIMKGELQRLLPEHVKTYITHECARACENILRDCLENEPTKRPFMDQVVDKVEIALKLQMQGINN